MTRRLGAFVAKIGIQDSQIQSESDYNLIAVFRLTIPGELGRWQLLSDDGALDPKNRL